jgi:hypothetical protein
MMRIASMPFRSYSFISVGSHAARGGGDGRLERGRGGSADYNLKLSDRRAASVVRYLTGKGIDAARLSSRGYGATRPLVSETDGNDTARAQNRRVELVKQ